VNIEGKRRSPGVLLVAGIFLGIVVLAYIGVEMVQRHRFTRLEGEAHAAVADFAASVRFDLDGSKRLVLHAQTDSRGVPPILQDRHWEEVGERGTSWFMVGVLLGPVPGGKDENPVLVVFVDQKRRVILGSPKLQVNFVNSKLTSVPEELARRFAARGLSYSIYAR